MDHEPFSVAVTVRVGCHDRDALFAAARASLLRDGTPATDTTEIMTGWTAADALAELISEGLARIPADDATEYDAVRFDLGVHLNELERSYSGESDVGIDDEPEDVEDVLMEGAE